MTNAIKGNVPHCRDQNLQAVRKPFTPAPTVNSKSDGGRYTRQPLTSDNEVSEARNGTGKCGNIP